jgi:hypothetical protein
MSIIGVTLAFLILLSANVLATFAAQSEDRIIGAVIVTVVQGIGIIFLIASGPR